MTVAVFYCRYVIDKDVVESFYKQSLYTPGSIYTEKPHKNIIKQDLIAYKIYEI